MDEDLFDEAATRRVANRAMISAALAFAAGAGGGFVPLASLVVIPVLVIAVIVAVSAIRTLNHPEARVLGGARHAGIVLAELGALGACVSIVLRVLVLLRS
jgi:hypothetical protein